MPDVVAGVVVCVVPPPVEPLPPPPPHPMAPPTMITIHKANIEAQRRRSDGIPSITTNARTEPLPNPQIFNGCIDAVEAAVVFTVSVVVPLPLLETARVLGFRLQVGKLCAPVGEAANVHVRFMVPE